MYKNRIIETIVFTILNFILAFINYIAPSEAIKSILLVVISIIILYVCFWLYELVKYQLLSLMFGNIKRSTKLDKIIALIICILFFYVSIFVYLIEYPKYVYLNDKLSEKLALDNVEILNRKSNKLVKYNEYDFDKDKKYTIFSVSMKNIAKAKKYIIYKSDPRHQLLKTYSEIYGYTNHNNDTALNYLNVSFAAIVYYKKEIKEIRKGYLQKVEEYQKDVKSGKDELKGMLAIQEYLAKTKLNNIRYNEIVRQMRVSPKFEENYEMEKWHKYFQNESDKELIRVKAELDKCNQDFNKNIFEKYKDRDDVKELLKKNENNEKEE